MFDLNFPDCPLGSPYSCGDVGVWLINFLVAAFYAFQNCLPIPRSFLQTASLPALHFTSFINPPAVFAPSTACPYLCQTDRELRHIPVLGREEGLLHVLHM